jgi:hypothetical protein
MSRTRPTFWRITTIIISVLLFVSIIEITPVIGASTSTQLLQDPGFESGDWSPWFPFGSPELVPQGHNNSAWTVLFGDPLFGNSLNDQVYQNLTVPTDYANITLSFWYKFTTQEVVPYADFICVGLYSANGSLTYAKHCVDIGAAGSVPDWTQAVYQLSPYESLLVRSQNIRFGISFTTDLTLYSYGNADDAAFEWELRTDWPTYMPLVNVSP